MYCIAENLWEKTFTNFVALEPPMKVSLQNLGMLCQPLIGFGTPRKFSP